MQESIQQLTEKIYREGIEKAEERAQIILEDAARKARDVVDEAEAKARQILEQAEIKAAELKLKNEAEMRLSARQAMVALKQHIAEMIVWKLNHESINEAISDVAYMQELIRKIMDNWLEKFGQESRLQFILPQEEYQQYRQFLEQHTGRVIQSGIVIEFTQSMKKGFQVVAVDQGFKVSFTDDDFENYFSSFARPRIYKLLFGKED